MSIIDLELTLKGRSKIEELLQSNVDIEDLSDVNKLLLLWHRSEVTGESNYGTFPKIDTELLSSFGGTAGLEKAARKAEAAEYLDMPMSRGREVKLDALRSRLKSAIMDIIDDPTIGMARKKRDIEYLLEMRRRQNEGLEAFEDDPEWE